MADVVDEDTEQAILALWGASAGLASLFAKAPQTGRLHSTKGNPQTLPYAHVQSEAVAGKAVRYPKGFRKDCRKVTITIRGTRKQVVDATRQAMSVFTSQMGAPGVAKLSFPSYSQASGLPKLVKWWPLNDGTLKQEAEQVQGLEVWAGVIEAEVYTARAEL